MKNEQGNDDEFPPRCACGSGFGTEYQLLPRLVCEKCKGKHSDETNYEAQRDADRLHIFDVAQIMSLTNRLDAHIRQNAWLRLALLDVYDRERAQDETTCWVRSKYGPVMSMTAWVEKVLDEANAMED